MEDLMSEQEFAEQSVFCRKRNVLFITNVPASFQLEVAKAYTNLGFGHYEVVCSEETDAVRGKHWMVANIFSEKSPLFAPTGRPKAVYAWLGTTFDQAKCDAIIVGGFRHKLAKAAILQAQRRSIPYALWMEPPDLRRNSFLLNAYGQFWLRPRLKGARLLACIGDRALSWYSKFYSGEAALLPYGQDLSECRTEGGIARSDTLTFVISGRLLSRNNVAMSAQCLAHLWRERPGKFQVILGASGPEEDRFWENIRTAQGLEGAVMVDREYDSWNDRLRPFKRGHVLLYPATHSGWGLIIPEAMACGCVPISTTAVEAARYYIEHLNSGLLVEPNAGKILEAMRWCADHPSSLALMSRQSRLASMRGEAQVIAKLWNDAVCRMTAR